MRTATDPRHEHRQKLVKELFEWEARQKLKIKSQKSKILTPIIDNIEEIDIIIEKNAGKWPKEKINNVDIAILRLAIFELNEKKVPVKVIIDEAVELAKEFGGDSSSNFVNGVLGSVVKSL